MMDIDHGFLDVAHFMSQQVYRNGRQGIVALHVLRVGIVHAQVLPEAQRQHIIRMRINRYKEAG